MSRKLENTVVTSATNVEGHLLYNHATGQPPRPKGRGLQEPSPFKVSPNQLKRLAWVTNNGE